MSHGHPDYGIAAPKKTTFALSDMAELAARLGSIVTFDRRGDVVWWDNFEDNIAKWALTKSGTGADVALSTDTAIFGANSAKLTLGDAVGNITAITRYAAIPVTSKIAFEISFTTLTKIDYVQLDISLNNREYKNRAVIRYYPTTGVIKYLDENNTYQTLATIGETTHSTYVFHTMKLVIDLTSYTYTRFILDEQEFDMSTLLYYHPTDTFPAMFTCQYAVSNGDTGNRSVYAENAIITQNEP